jgi:hypothetical protein
VLLYPPADGRDQAPGAADGLCVRTIIRLPIRWIVLYSQIHLGVLRSSLRIWNLSFIGRETIVKPQILIAVLTVFALGLAGGVMWGCAGATIPPADGVDGDDGGNGVDDNGADDNGVDDDGIDDGVDGHGDNEDAVACGTHGAGCETDADCCDGLFCYDWGCEPPEDIPDGGDGGTDDVDDGVDDGDDGVDGDDGGGTPLDHPGGIVADHSAAAGFDSIPAEYAGAAQSDYRMFYGHTSHGSQIITGMQLIAADDDAYAFNAGSGTLNIEENDSMDLGHEGDLTWVDVTREVLDEAGSNINIVMWSWCAGVSDNTADGINTYLDAMDGLEGDYPGVLFIYMTGHLDGSGPDGNLYVRNNQIRDYCEANGKILYDFADVESYDPDGNYYPDGSDWCEWCETWCATHTCPDYDCEDDSDCQHSMCFNCYQKGRAFWWMMARIAGWGG